MNGLGERFVEHKFSEFEKIEENVKGKDISKLRNLIPGTMSHSGQPIPFLSLNIAHHILDYLDHKHPIIPLCSHRSMRQIYILSEPVASQVALSSAPFPTHRRHSLQVPSYQTLRDTTHHQQVMGMGFGVGEDLFDLVVEKVESQRPGEQRDYGILLELIVEDRSIAFARFTDS